MAEAPPTHLYKIRARVSESGVLHHPDEERCEALVWISSTRLEDLPEFLRDGRNPAHRIEHAEGGVRAVSVEDGGGGWHALSPREGAA